MKDTSLLRGNNARAYMNYLKEINVPFIMTSSNYTVKFNAGTMQQKFVHEMQSNRVFAAFSKLKSNVKSKPIPKIDKEKLSYFVHDFKTDNYIGDVINIDLKSAYATVLYRDGYITEETYKYLCSCSKQQRLASVGMLASKKLIFEFDSTGRVTGPPIEDISETSNFFFYAVRRTGEIMNDLKQIVGKDYLFTWVDGIYFQPDIEKLEVCEKYIESIGFKYSVDWLRDFDVKITERAINVSFLKQDKKGAWKKKPFTLPLVESEFKRLVVDAILTHSRKRKR